MPIFKWPLQSGLTVYNFFVDSAVGRIGKRDENDPSDVEFSQPLSEITDRTDGSTKTSQERSSTQRSEITESTNDNTKASQERSSTQRSEITESTNDNTKASQERSSTQRSEITDPANDSTKTSQKRSSTQSKASDDVDELIDKIDEILVDNANTLNTRNEYNVEAVDISDDEDGLNSETEIKCNAVSPAHISDATYSQSAVSYEQVVNEQSELSDSGQHVTQSSFDDSNGDGLGSTNESAGDQIKGGSENEDVEEKGGSKDRDFANCARTETEKKSYIECMELEDISPPLSLSQSVEDPSNTNTHVINTLLESEQVSDSGTSLVSADADSKTNKIDSFRDSDMKIDTGIHDAVDDSQNSEQSAVVTENTDFKADELERKSGQIIEENECMDIGNTNTSPFDEEQTMDKSEMTSESQSETIQSETLTQISEHTVTETETQDSIGDACDMVEALEEINDANSALCQRSSQTTGM